MDEVMEERADDRILGTLRILPPPAVCRLYIAPYGLCPARRGTTGYILLSQICIVFRIALRGRHHHHW